MRPDVPGRLHIHPNIGLVTAVSLVTAVLVTQGSGCCRLRRDALPRPLGGVCPRGGLRELEALTQSRANYGPGMVTDTVL